MGAGPGCGLRLGVVAPPPETLTGTSSLAGSAYSNVSHAMPSWSSSRTLESDGFSGEGSVDQPLVLRGELEELISTNAGGLKEDVTEPTRRIPLSVYLDEHTGEAVEQGVHTYGRGKQLFL